MSIGSADLSGVPAFQTGSAVGSKSARLEGPDLLRALAILLVMLLHIRGEAAPGVLTIVRPYAWLGVDIFFVLSGYLIGTQLIGRTAAGRPISLPSFYLNRAFRILPAYLVVLAAYVLFPIVREAPDMAADARSWQKMFGRKRSSQFALRRHEGNLFLDEYTLDTKALAQLALEAFRELGEAVVTLSWMALGQDIAAPTRSSNGGIITSSRQKPRPTDLSRT